MIESIGAHPDFQNPVTWSMNAILTGTDDILSDTNKQTIEIINTQSVSSPIDTIQ